MRAFWGKFSVFISIWGWMIFESHFATLLLFLCAIAMGVYFYLPVMKNPLFLYIFLSLVLLCAQIVFDSTENMYSIFLITYIQILAVFQLSIRSFRMYTLFNLLIIFVCFFITNGWNMRGLLFALPICFLSLMLNQRVVERKEQRQLYEQLLGEYRNLKRMRFESDRSARLEERTKIAREIHDSVGHKLTALMMELEVLSMKMTELNLTNLKSLAKESLEETRHAVTTLRTEESEGIATVLQLIRKLESESHIMIHFTTMSGVLSAKLSNSQSIVLYRVMQEALTNAMRHAQSREVQVVLGRTAIGDIEWTVSNRIYQPRPLQFGFGLTNMRERVEEIGGSVTIYQTDTHFIASGSFPVK